MRRDIEPDRVRRALLGGATAILGSGLTFLGLAGSVTDPKPETSRIRILFDPVYTVLCYGPQFVAEELLRAEGFEDVQFMPYTQYATDWEEIANDTADISAGYASDYLLGLDA